MINNGNDVGFVQDIASLDRLRQQAVGSDKESEKAALQAAAKQFESIFTNMLFKSMRDANSEFKSDLFDSQTEDFYRQMLDEQRASEMTKSGSIGLADMIVAQLSQSDNAHANEEDQFPQLMERVNEARRVKAQDSDKDESLPQRFDSPESFVKSLAPYAEKSAQALGVKPSVLLAQAALETGWGSKVISNARGSSFNLFNIKADRRWDGETIAKQSLEYQDNVPVMEKSAFRSYGDYQQSFDDYVQFIKQNPRYQQALMNPQDSSEYIRAIHGAGYATDPSYSDKVLNVQKQVESML